MEKILTKILKATFENFFQISQSNSKNTKFTRVEESGLLFGVHKVTGKEMNRLIDQVQDEFISIYETLKDVNNKFGEIYNSIDALDVEYVNGINGAMESAEKAQTDIGDTVNNLIKTVEKLKIIEKKVERIEKMPASSIYERKIKVAYFVGGSAIALSIINFVLQLLGII